ncbi:MAG: rRNA maturation RNase YbeY [Alphaproteobacteria bacterium]|nr:MAG: rRNA maturation RNase YbeY [Alphaproteobacteria bacterium]
MMVADVIIHDLKWEGVNGLSTLIKKAMHGTNNIFDDEDCCPLSVTFTLMNDPEIQTLNKNFRQKDKPTNVLSFPDGEPDDNGRLHLGDIAIAFETLTRESKEQDISFKNHLSHLIVHGLLHLYGYDHEDDSEADEMESLEIEILKDMGIKNPYI